MLLGKLLKQVIREFCLFISPPNQYEYNYCRNLILYQYFLNSFLDTKLTTNNLLPMANALELFEHDYNEKFVAPVLIKHNETMNNLGYNDNKKILTELLKHLNREDFERFRITSNGDLLIYPSSNLNQTKIESCKNLFPNCTKSCRKLDKRPTLLIWGITLDWINSEIGVKEELEDMGIEEWNEVGDPNKNVDGKRKTKFLISLVCKNAHVQLKLFCTDIRIGGKQLIAEPQSTPRQCNQCHSFDHQAYECQNDTTCGNCGAVDISDHDPKKCPYPPFCCNCSLFHSAYFRKCAVYLRYKNAKLREIKTQLIEKTQVTVEQIKEWENQSKRNLTNTSNLRSLEEKFESLSKNLVNFTSTENKIEKIESDIELINKLSIEKKLVTMANSIQSQTELISKQTNNITAMLESQNKIISKQTDLENTLDKLGNYVDLSNEDARSRITNLENTMVHMQQSMIDWIMNPSKDANQAKINIYQMANHFLNPKLKTTDRIFPTQSQEGVGYQPSDLQ